MSSHNTVSASAIRLASLLTLAVAAACSGDFNPTQSTGGGSPAAAGLYTLQSSNDDALPFVVPNTTHAVILTYASIRIENDSYEIIAEGSYDGVARQLWSDYGTFRQDGAQTVFTSEVYHTTYGASVSSLWVTAVIPGAFQFSTNESFRLRFVNGSAGGQRPGAGHTPR